MGVVGSNLDIGLGEGPGMVGGGARVLDEAGCRHGLGIRYMMEVVARSCDTIDIGTGHCLN